MADEEPRATAPEDNEQSATPRRVIGRVLSPEGKPLAGASVAILSQFNSALFGAHEFVRAETGADGSFEITIGKDFGTQQRGNDGDLTSLAAPIIAWHPDVGLLTRNIPLKRVEKGQWSAAPADLTLNEKSPQRIRLRNWDGSPAAGVKVFVRWLAVAPRNRRSIGMSIPDELSPDFQLESDKDGIIELGFLPAVARGNRTLCLLETSGDATGVQGFHLTATAGRLEHPWQLFPVGPLAGTLTFEGTAAPEPLTLDIHVRHPRGTFTQRSGNRHIVESDEAGHFAIPKAVVGSLQVRQANWQQSCWRIHTTDGWLTPEKLNTKKLALNLRVTKGRRVTGQLIDRERGRVLAGKTVSLSSPYGIWQGKLTTDKHGHFS